MQVLHRGEDLEFAVGDDVGHFNEFELHAQIGLIGSEARHGFVVGHDGEARFGSDEIHIEALLKDRADEVFHHLADFDFFQERRFNIDLREFGLAVGTQVFVAEALDDLIVAVKARDHQHLLKELRRLRQRVEHTVLNAGRNEVVAGAFGGGLRENRRFNVDKAVVIQEVAHGLRHLKAQLQVFLHLRTAQIEHAVGKTRGFAHSVVVELERRRQRGIENFKVVAEHFHAARNQGIVFRAFRTGTHKTDHLQAVFIADLVGGGKDFRTIRIADNLHETFAVTQVDKDHTAVVTAAVSPPVEGNGLADELFINQATVNGTHKRYSGLSSFGLHCVLTQRGRLSQSGKKASGPVFPFFSNKAESLTRGFRLKKVLPCKSAFFSRLVTSRQPK